MNTIKQQLITTILLASVCLAAMAGDGINSGNVVNDEIGFYDAFGEDEFAMVNNSIQGSGTELAYHFVAGSAFKGRTSAQVIEYVGAGCTYSSSAMSTDLQLPNGVEILGVRLFYYNNGEPTNSVTTYLTSYDGAGNYTDHLIMSSTLSSGYNSEYFQPGAVTLVDNFNSAYVLTASMSSESNLKFCGMRVFYEVL